MKKTLLSVLLCCIFSFVFAQNEVSVQDARTVSKNYLSAVAPQAGITESDLTLKQTLKNEDNEALLYIFTIRGGGFVFVSASESVEPVLAYSLESEFLAEGCSYALNVYKETINTAKGTVNAAAKAQWNRFRNYEPTRIQYISSEVKPLLTSTWNQVTYYNNYCPFQADAHQAQANLDCDNHVPAGCVAADMAVIMFYYRYPIYGVGGVGYHPIHYVLNSNNEVTDTITYPWQVQNFNQKHDYNLMPNDVDWYTGEVAKLMWHAGMSVQMDYGPDGSGAQSNIALNAMKDNWGYNRSAQMYNRAEFSNAKWVDSIKKQIDMNLPIYYSANDGNGGHAFMFDGYQVYDSVATIINYHDTLDNQEIVEVTDSTWNDEDSIWNYETHLDTIHHYYHTDSTIVYDTTFNFNTKVHINWGWGGYNNGYFNVTGAGHVGGYTQTEQMMVYLYPANQAPKDTTGHENVYGSRGTISDGAGNLMYRPNTDRTWMIAAPGATRYRIAFARIQTEANADEVIFYKNGDLNNEAGRYSGNNVPSAFNINADSVLVRFVTNGNDVTGRGFVFDFEATIPSAYCDDEVVLVSNQDAQGTITDKGSASVDEGTPYRPESECSWRINGFQQLYISYPQIELGAGDFIDIFDVTQPNKKFLLKRIDNYNWPDDDVLLIEGSTHKVLIRFVSDNFEENNGWTLTYQTVTGIEENNGLSNVSVYPNPVSSTLNVDLTADFEGQLNFRIMDMTGRTLSTESVENYGGEMHQTINVSNLSKGMYILSIEGQNGNSVRKFIVE